MRDIEVLIEKFEQRLFEDMDDAGFDAQSGQEALKGYSWDLADAWLDWYMGGVN